MHIPTDIIISSGVTHGKLNITIWLGFHLENHQLFSCRQYRRHCAIILRELVSTHFHFPAPAFPSGKASNLAERTSRAQHIFKTTNSPKLRATRRVLRPVGLLPLHPGSVVVPGIPLGGRGSGRGLGLPIALRCGGQHGWAHGGLDPETQNEKL